MKVKTSVTLSSGILEEIDQVDGNRSAFLERAARSYLDGMARQKRDARDVEIINRNADYLNGEAAEVLEFQVIPE
jgi:metal-responsive CopG/Arc/MetJ family transcriptional regulator